MRSGTPGDGVVDAEGTLSMMTRRAAGVLRRGALRKGVAALVLAIFVLGGGDALSAALCAPPGGEAAGHVAEGSGAGHDHGHSHGVHGEHGSHGSPGSHAPDGAPDSHEAGSHGGAHDHGAHADCPFGGVAVMTCGAAASVVPPDPLSRTADPATQRTGPASPTLLLDGLPGDGPFRPPQG